MLYSIVKHKLTAPYVFVNIAEHTVLPEDAWQNQAIKIPDRPANNSKYNFFSNL